MFLKTCFPKYQKKLKIYINHYLNNIENYGVINKRSFDRVTKTLDLLRVDNDVEFIVDGDDNEFESYYIEPNVIVCREHNHKVFNEEFFAPILAIYPYNVDEKENTMNLCIQSNNYALTGAVFSEDDKFLEYANNKFRSKQNFYIK